MEELNCIFLEEPIQGQDKEYAQLKSMTELSLAGGESLVSKAQFTKWIESGVLDYLQPDSNLAGIDEIIAIDKLVKKKGLQLILHNWTNDINNSANIHLAAALESCSMVEANLTYNPLRNNLVKDPMILSKGEFTLSDKAGLGIELNQSIIDEHSFNVILKK
jgi:L-alanine-DL-glutamate epimerase-like enolase superfamily enzyme